MGGSFISENIEDQIRDNTKLIYLAIKRLPFIPDSVEREELEQEGMISLWRAIEKYNEKCGCKFSTHCVKSIYTDLLNYLQKQVTRKRSCPVIYELTDDMVSDSTEGFCSLVADIQNVLSPEEAELFLAKHLHGYTFEAITQRFNYLSVDQIRLRLSVAKKKLRTHLREYEVN